MRPLIRNSSIVLIWILLTLLLLAYLLQVANLVAYGGAITAGELLAFVEANGYEATDVWDYCMRYIWPYWLVICCVFVGVLYLAWQIFIRGTRIQRIIYSAIVTLLLVPLCFPLQHNIFRETMCVVHEIRLIRNHRNDNRNFAYHAKRTNVPEGKEIYVLAIGESLRYKNFSLNGEYERETTPFLKQQANLVLYSDYYANATLTQHAMPMLLTPSTPETFEEHFQYKTVAAAYHEVGFKTALVSHRAQLMNNGYHDYLAKDFDTTIFVVHDSLIAPALATLIEQNHKLFVVTNYLGNHMFYTNRTEDCVIWRPDYNVDPKSKNDSLFMNAYDNSLLYTDRILNNEIETLTQIDGICAWMFVSDHGEFICPHISGHGHTYHPTKEEYHVPLMVWCSEEYADAYTDKVENMTRQKDEPICADYVFWSVLDMAGIRVEENDNEYSIFNNQLKSIDRTLLLPDGKAEMNL